MFLFWSLAPPSTITFITVNEYVENPTGAYVTFFLDSGMSEHFWKTDESEPQRIWEQGSL